MEYVEGIRRTSTEKSIRVRFETHDVVNVLTMDAAANTEVLTGTGVGASVVDRVPLVRVTRRGSEARFAAVLEPIAKGAEPTVRRVAWSAHDGGIQLVVDRQDETDRIAIDGSEWNVR